jgi:hypothetical protein
MTAKHFYDAERLTLPSQSEPDYTVRYGGIGSRPGFYQRCDVMAFQPVTHCITMLYWTLRIYKGHIWCLDTF